jgi:hypothetical protein
MVIIPMTPGRKKTEKKTMDFERDDRYAERSDCLLHVDVYGFLVLLQSFYFARQLSEYRPFVVGSSEYIERR